MPLMDHFHPPLSLERHWESIHAAWAGTIADVLNAQLPSGYFAEEQTHAGASIEIDVATFEKAALETNGASVATAAPQVWAPPAPASTFAAAFSDDFEVRVFSARSGPRLVGAIELVSPRNKDRHKARQAFIHKCAGYLHQGVGLIVADIVTGRSANLHNDLVHLLEAPEEAQQAKDVSLYAVAYGPIRRQDQDEIQLWPATLALGQELPVLPLPLTAELTMRIDLEGTYTEACRRRRLA